MLDLRRVRVFHSVVEHGSFSAAAVALDYTQPAVSHHVSALEREIGQRLINRSVRPLSLTPAGQRLHQAAVIALAEFERAEHDLAALTSGAVGSVALGSVVSGLRTVVAPTTRAFRRRFPEVELSLTEGQPGPLLADLRSGRLDVAITIQPDGWAPPDPAVYVSRVLAEHTLVLVVAAGHRLAGRRAVRLRELTGERWVLPAATRWSDFRDEIDALLSEAGVVPSGVMETSDEVAGAQLVAVGEGVGLAPTVGVLPPPGVAFVPLRPAVRRHLFAVTVKGPLREPVRALVEELVRSAGQGGGAAYPLA